MAMHSQRRNLIGPLECDWWKVHPITRWRLESSSQVLELVYIFQEIISYLKKSVLIMSHSRVIGEEIVLERFIFYSKAIMVITNVHHVALSCVLSLI